MHKKILRNVFPDCKINQCHGILSPCLNAVHPSGCHWPAHNSRGPNRNWSRSNTGSLSRVELCFGGHNAMLSQMCVVSKILLLCRPSGCWCLVVTGTEGGGIGECYFFMNGKFVLRFSLWIEAIPSPLSPHCGEVSLFCLRNRRDW